jgi:transposase
MLATPSAWRGCWRPASSRLCASRAWRRSGCAIWSAPARTCAATLTAPASGSRTSCVGAGFASRDPGKNWTHAHRGWLRGLEFDDRASPIIYADYLAGVWALEQRRDAVARALAELAPESPWAQTIARLRCFRGIDTLAAIGLCAEIGEFERFRHPRRLSAFLGLVPCERTSDEKRRQGSITKAGPKHSRRLLVEAAKHSWRRPRISEELRRRQEGQDPRACEGRLAGAAAP